jgi:hypothetical protein
MKLSVSGDWRGIAYRQWSDAAVQESGTIMVLTMGASWTAEHRLFVSAVAMMRWGVARAAVNGGILYATPMVE